MKDTTIIGGSDGPTSVFVIGRNHKPSMKQRMQRAMFRFRKKWHALWIKPNPHTMGETANYIREKYDFVELPRDSKKYQSVKMFSKSTLKKATNFVLRNDIKLVAFLRRVQYNNSISRQWL